MSINIQKITSFKIHTNVFNELLLLNIFEEMWNKDIQPVNHFFTKLITCFLSTVGNTIKTWIETLCYVTGRICCSDKQKREHYCNTLACVIDLSFKKRYHKMHYVLIVFLNFQGSWIETDVVNSHFFTDLVTFTFVIM